MDVVIADRRFSVYLLSSSVQLHLRAGYFLGIKHNFDLDIRMELPVPFFLAQTQNISLADS